MSQVTGGKENVDIKTNKFYEKIHYYHYCSGVTWSQPEIAIWWDGIQLDSREDWNEDWAIVDGAGYHDIQVGLFGRVVSRDFLV